MGCFDADVAWGQWRRYTRTWQVKWPGENRNDLPDDLLAVSNEHFLDYEIIKPLAEHYRSNADDLSLELRQMKRMIERKTSEKTMPTFEGNKLVPFSIFVSKYEDAFFEMNRLLRIACTIPVTSVESERSFSCLKLIKPTFERLWSMRDCQILSFCQCTQAELRHLTWTKY